MIFAFFEIEILEKKEWDLKSFYELDPERLCAAKKAYEEVFRKEENA